MLINPLDILAAEIAAFTAQTGRKPARVELSLRASNDIRRAIADSFGLPNVRVLKARDVGREESVFMCMGVECYTSTSVGYFILAE